MKKSILKENFKHYPSFPIWIFSRYLCFLYIFKEWFLFFNFFFFQHINNNSEYVRNFFVLKEIVDYDYIAPVISGGYCTCIFSFHHLRGLILIPLVLNLLKRISMLLFKNSINEVLNVQPNQHCKLQQRIWVIWTEPKKFWTFQSVILSIGGICLLLLSIENLNELVLD